MEENKLAIFEGKHIRKTIHNNEWWFSIIDVIEVLTDSSIPKRYWSDLKRKLVSEGFAEAYEKIVQLKMQSPDGKMRLTDCANTETMLRIIQSIPSPKVEPLKRWLLIPSPQAGERVWVKGQLILSTPKAKRGQRMKYGCTKFLQP